MPPAPASNGCSQQTRPAPKWAAPIPPLPKSHNHCAEPLGETAPGGPSGSRDAALSVVGQSPPLSTLRGPCARRVRPIDVHDVGQFPSIRNCIRGAAGATPGVGPLLPRYLPATRRRSTEVLDVAADCPTMWDNEPNDGTVDETGTFPRGGRYRRNL